MKKTLQKILDELNKEIPRLDYIRGILEVLIENEEDPQLKYNTLPISTTNFPIGGLPNNIPMITSSSNEKILDEAEMMDKEAREKLAKIKALSDASTE